MKGIGLTLIAATALIGSAVSTVQASTARIMIPKPQKFERVSNESGKAVNFRFSPSTVILFEKENSAAKKASEFMSRQFETPFGYKLKTESYKKPMFFGDGRPDSSVLFTSDEVDVTLGREGYTIDVTKKGVTIKATDYAGFFYGLQTMRQLLPIQVESKTTIEDISWVAPACKISDKPATGWRGMHLDVSRHFFSVEEVKLFIDYMAQHKMNLFHWHLVDDGGWRIEIKKYPRLTEVGAWRKNKAYDTRKLSFPLAEEEEGVSKKDLYGGFYTQEQIREVVQYAKDRNIDVLPEIEMPGHSLPVLDAYPGLRCDSTADITKWSWGLPRQNSYCPGQEKTFAFLEDVLTEVADLFPFEYIHIGGDECDGFFWKECKYCQKRMDELSIRSKGNLQSWMINRIESHLSKLDRKLVGWDEIMEGAVTKDATVMFWLGMHNLQIALKNGHKVVMAPTNPAYFDYSYNNNSVAKVYNHDFIPLGLTEEQKQNIIGVQGCVWTEWMEDFSKVQYMIMPRMLALAENLWTNPTRKDSENFLKRVGYYYQRLDYMGVNYYLPAPRAKNNAVIFYKGGTGTVEFMKAGNQNFTIHYTTDGTVPTAESDVYTAPITVDKSTVVKAVTISSNGNVSKPTSVNCVLYEAKDRLITEPGLFAHYAEGNWRKVPDFSKVDVKSVNKVSSFDLSRRDRNQNFAFLFEGFITIEKEGIYTFKVGSDDGSWLSIAGTTVVDNDELHSYDEKYGNICLKPGIYPLELGYIQGVGASSLNVFISCPGEEMKKLPASMLSRPKK